VQMDIQEGGKFTWCVN